MADNTASIKINADASGVTKGVAVAQGALGKLQKQMGDLETLSARSFSFSGLAGIGLGATAAATAAVAVAAALIKVTKSAADYGDQLDNMSQRTGIAVEDLAKLQYAAKMSDTSSEALAKGVTNLSNLMAAAGSGAVESSKLFEKYGISVRNADGSMRSSMDVLGDLADIFSTMPDGVEKTAMATEFFGKKMGVELIPLLNVGKEGLKALGDEAERLGLVMSGEQTKAAAEFNDNLDRLSALAGAAGKSIGNELIPVFNKFIGQLLDARNSKLSLWQMLGLGLDAPGADPVKKLEEASAKLAKLKDELAAAKTQNQSDGGSIDTSGIEGQVAAQERLVSYYKDQAKRIEVEQGLSETKRALMAGQLATKLAELEKLRAIAAGTASIDILKSDKDLNAARLKDAEALRDALRAAYQASTDDAKSAAEAAIKLLDQARAKRNSAADRSIDASTQGMSEADKAATYANQAQGLYDSGRFYAAAAAAAKLDGRLKEMEEYAKKADEYLSRAEGLAGKSGDTGMMNGIAEAQAQALEAQAAAKQKEAADLQQRAADQMATLNQIEAKIKEMMTAAANFEIKADITQLETDIARIRADIAKGAVMPISTMQAGGGNVNPDAGASGSFEVGGFTGWMGRKTIAGVVHGQEYVTPAGITRQPGVLGFLEALRKYGNKVLPGYERGGLVTSLAAPSLASSAGRSSGSGSTINLTLDGNAYRMTASDDVAAALTAAVRREALKKGGRR